MADKELNGTPFHNKVSGETPPPAYEEIDLEVVQPR